MAETIINRTPGVLPDSLTHLFFHAASRGESKLVPLRAQFWHSGIDVLISFSKRDLFVNFGCDLGERLFPTDGLPLTRISRPNSLQGMLDPKWIIDRLDSSLSFETHAAQLCDRTFRSSVERQAIRQ